jgi:hypothetical protein
MAEYIYDRKCGQSEWQIGVRETNSITDIIQSQLSLSSKIKCEGDTFKIIFDVDLSTEQKNTLDGIVNNYIAIIGTENNCRIIDGKKISEETIEELNNASDIDSLKQILKDILLGRE